MYFAVRTNQIEMVKYLVEVANVTIGKLDRWGGAALDYALAGSAVETYLLSKNATRKLGSSTIITTAMSPKAPNMTDN